MHTVAGPLGADWYRSAVLLNALCAAGLLLLVHRWTRELCGQRIALFTLLALAALPEFFLSADKASSDLLFALLLGLALYLLLDERFSRRRLLAGTVKFPPSPCLDSSSCSSDNTASLFPLAIDFSVQQTDYGHSTSISCIGIAYPPSPCSD